MSDSRTVVFRAIQELLTTPPQGDSAPSLAHLEHTLTDGYAHALALEAERARLQERLREVATRADEFRNLELSKVAASLQRSEHDLSRLRGVLALLRARAATMRGAAQPA
jgi:hypothetical protein